MCAHPTNYYVDSGRGGLAPYSEDSSESSQKSPILCSSLSHFSFFFFALFGDLTGSLYMLVANMHADLDRIRTCLHDAESQTLWMHIHVLFVNRMDQPKAPASQYSCLSEYGLTRHALR